MREWLQNMRKSSGFTQQNVADWLGITKQFYQQIEAGQRIKDLNTSMIMALANLFNTSAIVIVEKEQKYQSKNIPN